jgi:hypothetical protein
MIVRPDTGDGNLVAIQVATLLVLTESGRIQHENDPDRSAGPRLYLAGCESGNVIRIRHDVGAETARAVESLSAAEPPLGDPDSTSFHLDDYADLLAREAPVEHRSVGLIYCFPNNLKYEHNVTLVGSNTPEGDRLLAGLAGDRAMPHSLMALGFTAATDLWAPWCVAVHREEIASIAMTARIGPRGAEAGVITVPELRGRGFAKAATSGWASLPSLKGRALFYSTDRTNVPSRRVADRLGLRFIGTSLRIT